MLCRFSKRPSSKKGAVKAVVNKYETAGFTTDFTTTNLLTRATR
jgi:hypothetical protein